MTIQWPLVLFTILSSLGGGAFGFVAIMEWMGKGERTRIPGAITALVLLAAGGFFSVLHLGHPERIFNALGHFGSGITYEMFLIGLTGLAIVAYIALVRLDYPLPARKAAAAVGLVLAVVLVIVMSATYVLVSRPAWNTFLLPLVHLALASVLGLFVMSVWVAAWEQDRTLITGVYKAALIVLAIEAVTIVLYGFFLASAPYPDPSRSLTRVLAGDLSVAFWGGLVLVGFVVPFGLTAYMVRARKAVLPGVAVAVISLLSVTAGGLVARAMMFVLGSSALRF